jgi:hypothetical protein
MAAKVTGDAIAFGTVVGANIASSTVTGSHIAPATITKSHTDSSIAKVVTLTQAAYDALSTYEPSTLYITT